MDIITNTSKKRILIIGTGGTIAGKGPNKMTSGYSAAQLNIQDLVSEIPGLENLAELESKELFSVDSCDMNFANLMVLSNYINEKAQSNNFDGFVITHGTDTLEETAYFLNLTLKTEKPVVITGAMRPSTAMSADGPMNLYQAVALATSQKAFGKGVLITFADGIYSARDVAKINTFRTDAFSQKDLGCLGYMHDSDVFMYSECTQKHCPNTEFEVQNIEKLPKVEIVTFYPGADINILKYISQNADGIVVAGAGAGGCSTEWNNEIEKILSQGTPIVRSSRVGNGLVNYSKDQIYKKGVFAGNLSPQKARVLLTLALTKTSDLNTIQNIFDIY